LKLLKVYLKELCKLNSKVIFKLVFMMLLSSTLMPKLQSKTLKKNHSLVWLLVLKK
jgi:hypothetical protein